MTYCGPYSTATLTYENPPPKALGVVASDGTILHEIGKRFPNFFDTVRAAGLTALYDYAPDEYASELTVFVPLNHRPIADRLRSATLCRASTTNGRLDVRTLTSSPLSTVRTLSPANDVVVKFDGTCDVRVNESRLLYGDIECVNGIIHVMDRDVLRV